MSAAGFFCLLWRKRVTFFKVQLQSRTFRRRKDCTLKSVNKSRSRLKRRRESVATGGFHSKECKCLTQLTTPPKPQKSSFCTIHKTVLQNPRATGARIWGSVHSKTIFDKNVTLNICKQSTGLTFPTILPMAR